MRASEVIKALQTLEADDGDKHVMFDDGCELQAIIEVYASSEEDDCIVIC